MTDQQYEEMQRVQRGILMCLTEIRNELVNERMRRDGATYTIPVKPSLGERIMFWGSGK